jgi:tetratricopeptide (TPR) repeat protein
MNNRTPFILITALVALVLAFFCAQKLAVAKQEINPAVGKKIIHPLCMGFNKFFADLAWMQSLQHRGSIDKLNDDLAEILYRRADKLTALDPFFFEAYSQSALEIGYLKQERALQLLNKALDTGMCKDWNIPFRGGWICAYWKDDPEEAVKYYEKARTFPGAPSHINRLILYQKAKLAKNDPEVVLQLWCNYIRGTIPSQRSQGMSPQLQLDPYDMQLAIKKINDMSDKVIGELKTKPKDAETDKRIAYIQQLVADASSAADRAPGGAGGAVNSIVPVKAQRTTVLEARSGRKGFSIQNNGKKTVLLKLGYGASKMSYGFVLAPGGASYSANGYEDIVTAVCPDGESEVAVIETF